MRPNDIDIDKKKSHCLRNCIIVSLVMIVVISGALFGGIYFAYNSYAEPILGISLFDAFGIINNVGRYDKEAILTNKFTEQDSTDFYAGLENATCLDLPADFKISKAVNALMQSKGDGTETSPDQALEGEGTTVPGDTTAPESSTGGLADTLNSFTTGNEYLDSVLQATSFDRASLSNYENGGKDLIIKDRQFAAVIDEVLRNLDMPELNSIAEQLGVAIKDLVSIEQVTISNKAETSLEAMLANETVDTPGVDTATGEEIARADLKISIVLCLHLGDNVATILNKQTGGSLPEFVGGLAATLLPQEIYVGVGVFPYNDYETEKPELFINNVKGDIMNNLLTAVDGVLKQSDPNGGVAPMMTKLIDTITSTITTIEGMVGKLRFVDSSLALDPITMAMTALGVNDPDAPIDPETGKRPYVTGDNVFTMLKHIYNASNEIDKMTGTELETKKEAFLSKLISEDNKIKGEDYTNNITALSQAYGVEKVVDAEHPENSFDMSTWTPAEFVERYSEIPAHINIVNKRADGTYLYNISQEDLLKDTFITDNAMGYIVNDLIAEKVASGELPLPIAIKIDTFELYAPEGLPDELRARFVGEISTAKLLDDVKETAVLKNIAKTILPDYLFLELDLPMSTNAGSASLIINFVGRAEDTSVNATEEEKKEGIKLTKDAFDTLYRLVKGISPEMGEQIKLENLLATIQGLVNEMLEMINGTKEETPAPAPALAGESGGAGELKLPPIKLQAGGVQMPTIYDMMRTMMGDLKTESSSLQLALEALYTYSYVDDANKKQDVNLQDATAQRPAQSDSVLETFITNELENKLFLVNKEIDAVNHIKEINKSNLFSKLESLGSDMTDPNKSISDIIKIRGANSLLESDETDVNNLKLAITDEQLAAIINTSGKLNDVAAGMPFSDFKVTEGTKITKNGGNDYMSLTLRAKFDANALGDAPMGMKYENLLPGYIYLTANIQLTGNTDGTYGVDVYINNTSDVENEVTGVSTKDTIDTVLGGMMPGSGDGTKVSFAEIERMLGEYIGTAFDMLSGTDTPIAFGDGKITAMSIYDVIYDKVIFPNESDPDRANVDKQDVMDIFRSVLANVTLEYYTAPAGVFNNLINNEINNKMLLNDKNKIDADKTDDIFAAFDALKEGDVFSKVDLQKVTSFNKADEMIINVLESELTAIMRKEMSGYDITGLPSVFQIPGSGTADASPLVSFSITADNQIEVVFGLNVVNPTVEADKATYKNILPFLPSAMKVTATIGIDVLKEPIIDENNKVIKIKATTHMLLNDLKDSKPEGEKKSNYEKAKIIMGKMSDGFNMDDIETQISGQIASMFTTILDAGMPLEFKKSTIEGKQSVMRLGSIYDVIHKVDKARFETITNDELHSVMRGIQDINNIEYINSADETIKPSIDSVDYSKLVIQDPVETPNFPQNIINIKGTASLSDYYLRFGLFGDAIKDGDKAIGTTTQMAILSKTKKDGTVGSGYDSVANNKKYMVKNENYNKPGHEGEQEFISVLKYDRAIVLGVVIEDTSSYNNAAGGFAQILPEKLYVTLIFDIPSGKVNTKDIAINTFINNMSATDMTTLGKILDGNDIMSNIEGKIKNSVLKYELPIMAGQKVSLETILCSETTNYVDYSDYNVDGMMGTLDYRYEFNIPMP